MKNNKLMFAALTVVGLLFASCGSNLKPLPENSINVTPSPLELVGTKVPVTINGAFPAGWFNKNAVITVTPVLKYQGQEMLGIPQTYQGENVAGNGIVIPQKSGGTFTLKSTFDYVAAMQKSELYLRFDAGIKGKSFLLPDLKIADGVSSTASLASALGVTPAEAPDKYQRIIKEAYDADIMFLIQQAELRSSELNSSNLAAWKDLVKEANDNDRKYVNVEIAAYASPDGGLELNEKLAEKREKNTAQYLEKDFSKKQIDTEINAKYTAQDWDGFKQLVEASSLQDKELVLRVLSMYSDPETREREIKNISVVYKELAETILPKLRRSRLIANIEIIGKTDEELVKAIKSNSTGDLSVEELLYAANLTGIDKEAVYTLITQKYPDDYRGWNNLGAYYYAAGQTDKANSLFSKALSLSPKSAEANMNTALNALENNDLSKAQELLGLASQANTANEALGLLYLKQGDYSKAVQAFGDAKTNNAAVAQILNKDYNKAQQTLKAVTNKDAQTSYLSAIVAARTNNIAGVAGNLKEAIQKDPDIKKYAGSDLEIAKFLTNPDISNMLK
ncbi:MAG: tetratricopeptide repeat protein [Prevotella sp.]|jgi:tetratricopeptide (TPR) repeat protein|nr:tetratricopeptide repeat protein [Prevotella sp.]